jgi:hypothetical protein
MATYTPIPVWLSMPWPEVCAWAETVVELQQADRAAAGREEK